VKAATKRVEKKVTESHLMVLSSVVHYIFLILRLDIVVEESKTQNNEINLSQRTITTTTVIYFF